MVRLWRTQPDSCLPGTFLRLVTLPDKEGRGNLAVLNLTAAMDKRWQTHGTQAAERHLPEITLFVTAAESDGENLFGEPAVNELELRFIGDVFEIVVDDGDIADTLLEGMTRDFDGELGALARIKDTSKLGAFATESKTKNITNFA